MLPKSPLGEAFGYALSNWVALNTFVEHGILEADSLAAQIANLRLSTMTDVTRTYVPAESVEEQWDLAGLEKVLRADNNWGERALKPVVMACS